MRLSLRTRARAWRGAVETLKGASHAALQGCGMNLTEVPRVRTASRRDARATRCRFEGRDVHPKKKYLLRISAHSGSQVRTLLSYAKKIISYRRFVRRIRTHPRAQSAPPCGARPCTNPFFAPSRAILVTMAIETVRARLSREPEPRVPRAFPAAHPVFSSASHPGGSFHPCGSAGADARSATRPRCSAPRASRAAARSPS